MVVDRTRFLELTMLLSAAACAHSATEPAPAPTALAPSPRAYAALPPPPEPPELPTELVGVIEPTVAPSCNDDGEVQSCSLLTPTCENGDAAWCRDASSSFRPKIIEGWSRCVKRAEHGRCAPSGAARQCLKQVIAKGCIDPVAEETCKTLMSECHEAGRKVHYDLATCARIVSAVVATRGTPGWQEQNLELLGPTAEDRSCALDYVLNYYPFGR